MKTLFFKGILLNDGWMFNVYVTLSAEGKILSLSNDHIGDCERFDCYAIPGFQNAHSHAFQYAMAGLAETHSTDKTPDDFWSWREAMYELALRISPEDLQSIAAQLYAEMLRHGYTDVAEFHYVHHDRNGKHYSNLSEMGERLVAAASETGIGITLIPIFYQKGGFGKPAQTGQKRFISEDISVYYRLLDASKNSCSHYVHANPAIGIHSMRGVEPTDIAIVAKELDNGLPFHIHISEQLKEIEDAKNYLNARPVEWMIDHVELGERFHFVHATHLNEKETELLAQSGTHVVLCPSTEGNLGDGIFPLRKFQKHGGKWSIGTDSHVGLNPFEELRILDYGQRLTTHKRNIFYSSSMGDAGTHALDMVTKAGRKAMGNDSSEYFKVGDYLDAVLMRADAGLLSATSPSYLLSTMLYSSDASMQYGTISKGKLVVKDRKHLFGDHIQNRFNETIAHLENR